MAITKDNRQSKGFFFGIDYEPLKLQHIFIAFWIRPQKKTPPKLNRSVTAEIFRGLTKHLLKLLWKSFFDTEVFVRYLCVFQFSSSDCRVDTLKLQMWLHSFQRMLNSNL